MSRGNLDLVGFDTYGWDGGYTTAHFSRLASPKEMLPKGIDPDKAQAIQIETNKRNYLDEKSFMKNSGFGRTKSAISYCLENIKEYKPR